MSLMMSLLFVNMKIIEEDQILMKNMHELKWAYCKLFYC